MQSGRLSDSKISQRQLRMISKEITKVNILQMNGGIGVNENLSQKMQQSIKMVNEIVNRLTG